MRQKRLLSLLLLRLGVGLYAVESVEQPMTIVRAGTKARDRVVAWVNDTPFYQQDPYFEVAVRAGTKLLEAERDPEHPFEMLPVFWLLSGQSASRPCSGPAVGESVMRSGLSQTSVCTSLRKNDPS